MEAPSLEAPATALPPAPAFSAPEVAMAPPITEVSDTVLAVDSTTHNPEADADPGANANANANPDATEQTWPEAIVSPTNELQKLDQSEPLLQLPQTPVKLSTEVPDAAEMLPPPSADQFALVESHLSNSGIQGLDNNPFSLAGSGLNSLSGLDGITSFDQTEASAIDDSNNTPSPDPMQAFAKLQFEDGDFYVNTYAIKLGRDVNALKHERRNKRLDQRRIKRDPEGEAQEADQESTNGDGGLFTFRRRNPAMSVSNVSETGGIMGVNPYSDSDDSKVSRKKKKKHMRSSNSSHSVEPRTLHANPQDLFLNPFDDEPDQVTADPAYECPLVPIHPPTGQTYKGISREHVKIEYSLNQGIWEMTILGRNGAYLDGQLLKIGETAKIGHGSEILIHNIKIIFKLPDNARDDEVQETYESDSSLSELASAGSSDNSSDDEPLRRRHKHTSQSPMPRKIIKLKLSLKKAQAAAKLLAKKDKVERPTKSGKQPAKTNKPEKSDKAEQQAAKAVKAEKIEKAERAEKAEKAKAKEKEKEKETEKEKEKAEAKPTTEMLPPAQPAEVTASVERDELQQAMKTTLSETPPVIPAELPAGSVLIGVAPEDVPQKRKGPGRPPKNGVMSKRDEAIIKRKRKEFEKAGLPVPTLTELLQLARAEGSVKKDKPEDGREEDGFMKPATESETPAPVQESATVTPSVEIHTEAGMIQALTQMSPEKDPNKPKRIAKSPSPQKPESEYTEEELKKPTATYVVLIHEALSKSDSGVMDLQQIYDAMQKNWPWFKYRSQTHGWQSSVRHNLISSEAFQEAGKIGKGRLWKINPEVSIDKEKKRKAPTPPPERPAQPYPYYPNGQYPYAPQPGAPASYPQQYRPSPYGTPYGPPTVPSGPRPPVPAAQQKPGTYYSPYASNPAAAGATHASPYGPPSRPPYAPYAPQAQSNTPGQPPRPAPSPYGPPASQPGQPPQPGPPTTQPGQQPPQPGMQMTQPGQQPLQQPVQQNQQPGQAPAQTTPQMNGQPPRPQSQTPISGQPPQAQAPMNVPPQPQPQPQLQTQAQQPADPYHEKMIDNIMNYHKSYVARFATPPEQEKARLVFRQATHRCLHLDKDHGAFASKDEEELVATINAFIAQSRAEQARASPSQQPSYAPPTNAVSQRPYQPPVLAPPAPMQVANGHPPQTSTSNALPAPAASQPQVQQNPVPQQGQAQYNRASAGPERDLVQALNTAMPGGQTNASPAVGTPATNGAPAAYGSPFAAPNHSAAQAGNNQNTPTHSAQAPMAPSNPSPAHAAAPFVHPQPAPAPAPAYQSPMPPRPVMAPTPTPPTAAPAPPASMSTPAAASTVHPPVQATTPAPPTTQAAPPAPPSTNQTSTPTPAPQATMTAPTPASAATTNGSTTAAVAPVIPPDAGGSMKRPIALDSDDESASPEKKQKTN